MRANKTSLLDHLRWARQAVSDAGGDLLLAGDTFQLLLRRQGALQALQPRFLDTNGLVLLAPPTLEDHVQGFAGWLPYGSVHWPLAEDHLQLINFARRHDVAAPEAQTSGDVALENVVVHRPRTPGANAVLGPYRSAAERPLDTAAGEYYQQFLVGTRVRFWCWNGATVCGELQRMPAVQGDGSSTLRELILERASYDRPLSQPEQGELLVALAPLLHLQGHSFTTVLAPGTRAFIEHRIDSPLMHPADRQTFLVDEARPPGWATLAQRAAAALMAEAPPELRSGLLFTLDGIVDAEQRFWLLAMNANPVVHPGAYAAILTSVFEQMTPAATVNV